MSDIVHEFEMEYRDFKMKVKGERDFVETKIGDVPQMVDKLLSVPRSMDDQDINEKEQQKALAEAKPKMIDISLSEFLKQKKFRSNIDIVLGIGYYLEKYKGVSCFSSNDIKLEAKSSKQPSLGNITECLNRSVTKAFVRQDNKIKGVNQYTLTINGEAYIENYEPKDTKGQSKRKNNKSSKPKTPSIYSSLTREQLSLDNYPTLKELKDFKSKMVLAMYIITTENKGEYFSVNDLSFILTDVFGESVTDNQINGVINRNTDWFNKLKDEKSKVTYKLLNKGNDFAGSIIKGQD